MKETIFALISLMVLSVSSAGGQDVAAEFTQLRQAIEQSSVNTDVKTAITNWTFVAESTLTDGSETIFANKLMDFIKCLVDLYLSEGEKDGAFEPIDAIRFAFQSMPNPVPKVVDSTPDADPPDDCLVKIRVSIASSDHVTINNQIVSGPITAQFVLHAEIIKGTLGKIEWFHHVPLREEAASNPLTRVAVSPDGSFASWVLTDVARSFVAANVQGDIKGSPPSLPLLKILPVRTLRYLSGRNQNLTHEAQSPIT